MSGGASKADRMPLGGLVKRQLVRDLAETNLSQTALAEKYGVSQPAISAFAKRNREEIEAVKAKADDEYAGLLIAQKQNRLAAYQDLYAAALEPAPKIDNKGNQVIDRATGELVYEVDLRAAAQMLKQAAEELGQLPNRLKLEGEVGVRTNYTVTGVDPGNLK